jgi:Gas vesicle protein
MTVEPSLRRSSGVAAGGFGRQPDSLADVLERVLDKGIVIAGDIVVSILDIELLTLKVRLFVSSADTAREMGLDWWSRDPFFTGQREQTDAVAGGDRADEVEALQRRIAALEEQLRASRPEIASTPADERARERS